ncbi:MAG: SUMF1/EgtB/PvdO family nonheme iron enzyme [Burkholderiales bacterium]|nr:SUMF1/EgtB/PvdO family nonheme iron enzyme [Burkholderiales bacterium]
MKMKRSPPPFRDSIAGTLLFCYALAAHAIAAEAWLPSVVEIPAGAFIAGSDSEERELAYRLDEAAYGGPVTREQHWYEAELPRRQVQTTAYAITMTPITNRQYAAFIATTQHRPPAVDRASWASYALNHPYQSTRRFAWKARRPPAGREEHPVVLVSLADALAYTAWLSRRTGQVWRLPTELEWEKAARGEDGRYFPWGNEFDPARLNSHDAGPYDTTAVGRYGAGASPYGLLDGAGQVYQWTASAAGPGRAIVKGGSWDDSGCGVCRPAARHSRPTGIRHILIGFRLVREK